MNTNSPFVDKLHIQNENSKEENDLAEIVTQEEQLGGQGNEKISKNIGSISEKLELKKDKISDKLSEIKEKMAEKLQIAASLALIKSQHLAEDISESQGKNLDYIFSKMKKAEQEIKKQFS